MAFKKATKYKSRLRCAMFGPSGAGKTMTALLIAHGMGTKIAVLDSENLTASKYAGRKVGNTTLAFDTDDLGNKTIGEYIDKMSAAAEAGYDVLVVDSASHAWKELLEEVEKIAKAKYRGNTWSAWSEGNPMQNLLVDAIQNYPGHLIMTMRSKTEWVNEKTSEGKTKPVRVGLAPEQGKGIEYEFDILIEMDEDNNARVIKDRTGKFQGKIMNKPGVEFGKELLDWLSDGEVPPPEPERPKIIKASDMVQKIQSVGPETLELLRKHFRDTQQAYGFGQKYGWDEELMFAEFKRMEKEEVDKQKEKEAEDNKKATPESVEKLKEKKK